jgi:small subunit ribosomal protein S25e
MGGKKKLSLKQMERMQARKEEEEKEKKKKEKAATTSSKDRRSSDIIPPDPKNEKIISELKKMPVLTPYTIATRFNMRISVAKDFLEQLEENGVVQLVSGNHDIKIYKPVG